MRSSARGEVECGREREMRGYGAFILYKTFDLTPISSTLPTKNKHKHKHTSILRCNMNMSVVVIRWL